MVATERPARHRRRRRLRGLRNSVVGIVGPGLVRLWIGTLRVRYVGISERDGNLPRRPNGIFVFWHQRLLAFAGIFHHTGFKAVVSRHGDGEMLVRVLNRLGIEAIRGSTARGGEQAIREILKACDPQDTRLAITPDGPRGPRFSFREGAIFVASRTGLPVWPVAVSYHRYRALPTWDGFLLPAPFTRTVLRLGEPMRVPPDLDREGIEEYRRRAEAELRAITEDTDARFEDLYREAKRCHELEESKPVAAR